MDLIIYSQFIYAQVIESETAKALNSESWVGINLESVQEFLRMDLITAEEIDLVRALIRWGKFQVQTDGDDPEDGTKLKSKILPCLNLVRFLALSHKEFAQLCLEELGTVLSAEEKYSVMMSIAMQDWSLMPVEIIPANLAPRKKAFIVCTLPYESHRFLVSNSMSSNQFDFKLDREATFVGLEVTFLTFTQEIFQFTVDLMKENNNCVIGTGSSERDTFLYHGKNFCKITPKCSLAANTKYKLLVSFPRTQSLEMLYLPIDQFPASSTCDGLTITIYSELGRYIVKRILFDPFQ